MAAIIDLQMENQIKMTINKTRRMLYGSLVIVISVSTRVMCRFFPFVNAFQ